MRLVTAFNTAIVANKTANVIVISSIPASPATIREKVTIGVKMERKNLQRR